MAIIATENFDGYLNGSTLGGQNGGTGFTGAWVDVVGSRIVENTTVVSGNAVAINAVVASLQRRNFTTPISVNGYCSYYLRKDTARRRHSVFFKSGATYRAGMGMGQTGDGVGIANNIYISNAGATGTAVVTNYNLGQWYMCEFEFNMTLNQARGRVDGGAFSSWITMGGVGNLDTLELFYDSAVNDGAFVDEIVVYDNPIVLSNSNSLFSFGGI